MAKKHKPKHRNARPRRRSYRNRGAVALPMARVHSLGASEEEYGAGERLAHAAMGAVVTTTMGAFLANQGWKPETISGALALAGAGLAWKGDGEVTRNIGSSVMSAACAQFGLLMLDKRKAAPPQLAQAQVAKRNGADVENGALQAALERARMRMALEGESYQDAA